MSDSHDPRNEKVCPRCAETVKAAALVCRFCGYQFGSPVLTPALVQPLTVQPAPTSPKPFWTLGKFLAALLLFVLVVGGIASFSNHPSTTSVADNSPPPDTAPGDAAPAPGPAPPPPLKISSEQLAAAYSANEVAATNTYGGKVLDVTGVVSGVRLDMFDTPVIELAGINMFLPVAANFSRDDKDTLAKLSKGQGVTVRCTVSTSILQTPVLDDCSMAPVEAPPPQEKTADQDLPQPPVPPTAGAPAAPAPVETAPSPDDTAPPLTASTDDTLTPAETVVKKFYAALSQDDGGAASALVMPEKRNSGPLSADAITKYYASFQTPLHVTAEQDMGASGVIVAYHYADADGLQCSATAVVQTAQDGSASPWITGIKVIKGNC